MKINSKHYSNFYSFLYFINTLLILLLFPIEQILSQNSSDFSLVGRWAIGESKYVTVSGNIAYQINGGYLDITNVADPLNPELISRTFIDKGYFEFENKFRAIKLEIYDDFLFICSGNFLLKYLDVSNPASPLELSPILLQLPILYNNYLLGIRYSKFHVFDFSNPKDPLLITSLDDQISYNNLVKIIIENNNAMMLVNDTDSTIRLDIYDISDPQSPSISKSYFYSGTAMDMIVQKDFLYIAKDENELLILDITDTKNIQTISQPDARVSVKELKIYQNYLYGLHDSGIHVFDISNPSFSIDIKPIITKDDINNIEIENGILYLSLKDRINIYTLTDPKSPSLINTVKTGHHASTFKVKNNYGYLADGKAGLYVLDVSTPTDPTAVANIRGDFTVTDLDIEGNNLYLANGSDGLSIFDISTPDTPVQLGTTFAETPVTKVLAKNNTVYIINSGFLKIIDVSDPTSPEIVSEMDFQNIHGFYIDENYVYLATHTDGLYILDISDPENINIVSQYNHTRVDYTNVQVLDNYAYLSDIRKPGFRIIDISDKLNPVEISQQFSDNIPLDIKINGNRLYTTGLSLESFDITDLFNPVRISGLDLSSSRLTNITLLDDYLFVSGREDGIYILQDDIVTSISELEIDVPYSFALHNNYPNPFNPETSISFNIPATSFVSLKIYNITGKLVKTLVNENLLSGSYQIKWDGTNIKGQKVGSGVYIYKIKAGNFTDAKKMLLIK